MYWSQITTDDTLYNYEYFSQKHVCRLCWKENVDTEMFTNNSSECSSELIKELLQIDINENHLNKICDDCYNEINRFYNYKKFCLEADAKLRSILQKGLEESKIIDLASDIVKTENIEDSLDDIDAIGNYFGEAIDYEEPDTEKILKTRPEFRKKRRNRSPNFCNVCSIDLKSKEQFSRHNTEFHGIENDGTSFKCFGCEKRFKSRKTRMSHEEKFCKGLNDGYKCIICDRYLPKRCMYECHMRDHRNNMLSELPEHIFKCSKCLKSFKTKELLKNHMMEHVKEKNFVCDICGRVFTRQDYWYKHRLTHTGTKRHQCPHCDFRATQRSSLIVHIRKHTGERPYSCDVCPQRCTSSSNLRAHRRRHLGDKKFECAICNKKFGYKISLKEHISSAHESSESFPCEHCSATFTRVRGLRRHLVAKHGKLKTAKSKHAEQNLVLQVTETNVQRVTILKEVEVEYELKDGQNVLLLKHQDGDVYMV